MPASTVTIYTDGACLGNPGPGGWAAILISGGRRKEISGGYRLTTNNRMELMAILMGLEALKEASDVRLYSDSTYVVKSFNSGAAAKWQAKGWRLSNKRPAQNVDLWERLLELCEKHTVEMIWVQGHAGHPENERCDRLSNQAARRRGLPADEAFEQGETRKTAPTLF